MWPRPTTRTRTGSVVMGGLPKAGGTAFMGSRRPLRNLRGGGFPAALEIADVIARQRDGVAAAGELELEHDPVLAAEKDLRGGQVELPHPAKTLALERLGPPARRREALPPVVQR